MRLLVARTRGTARVSNWYVAGGKRCFDVVAAIAALVTVSPLLAVLIALVWADEGRSVLFRQRRVGRNGESFELFKLRSMRENVGDFPSTEASAASVTPVGRVLRRSNLDELPQLVNILRGDMSVVGPRPALESQAELLHIRSMNGASRLRPGLTGLAQVASYDRMPVSEKARLDGEYAKAVTCAGDMLIIWRTFAYLLRPPPVY